MLERSLDLIVTLPPVLETGWVCVFFDPTLPCKRLAQIQRETDTAAVPSQGRLALLFDDPVEFAVLDGADRLWMLEDTAPMRSAVAASDVAYGIRFYEEGEL
jgi:non-ribosomal peptide synthetase component F